MKSRKIIVLILVLSILIVFAGCSESKETKPNIDINQPDTVYDDIMDSEGKWVLDPTGTFSYLAMKPMGNTRPFFDEDYEFPENMFLYQTNTPHVDDIKLYGYMDTNFKKLSDPISTEPNIFMNGLARIESDSGYYIVNTEFEKKDEIYPGYTIADSSIIRVDWTNRPAANPYIHANIDFNEYLVPFNASDDPANPIFGYKTVNDAYFNDIPIEENFAVSPVFTETGLFRDGLAAVQFEGKWGYINEFGETVIDFIYDDAKSFSEGIASVFLICEYDKKGRPLWINKWAMINKTGNLITPYKFSDVEESINGLCIVHLNEYPQDLFQNIFNSEGKQITAFGYTTIPIEPFSYGFTRVTDAQGAWYFIDEFGKNSLNKTFYAARNFSDGLAAVKPGKKLAWGYLNPQGTMSIEANFMKVGDFSQGYAFVNKDLKKPGYLIDKAEKGYLKGLELSGISRFNENGYAIAFRETLVEIGGVTRQETTYYMIHIEQP